MDFEGNQLLIRPVRSEDLPSLWNLAFKDESPEWKKWDAPYYDHQTLSWEDYLAKKESLVDQKNYWVIEIDSRIIGTVSYYWEHKPSNWLEMGIDIYDPNYWNGGFGRRPCRFGLTTYSIPCHLYGSDLRHGPAIIV